MVVDYSEIDLHLRQAKQIAREIVNQVRIKVGHCTTVVPTADQPVRHDKGIVVAELLTELSLSPDAYEELKAGASSEAVKTLVPAATLLPEAQDEKRTSCRSADSRAVGYLAHDRATFSEERGLRALGK